MSKHHKICSPINQYTSCSFIASADVDQGHELYEPRYGDGLCYVTPCIMSQKILDGFVLNFIRFAILFSRSLFIQLEFTSLLNNIKIICFHISCTKICPLCPIYLQDFAV